MSVSRAALAVLLSLTAVVVWRAPAAWLAAFLPPPMKFRYASGTVWDGQAVLEANRIRCSLAWRLMDVGWPWAKIDVRLDAPCQGAAQLEVRRETIMAHGLSFSAQAALSGKLVPGLESWQPGGEVRISAGEVQLAPRTQGQLSLEWRGVKLAGLPVATLGDYQAQATIDGNRLSGRVNTLNGPLQLAGQFELGPQARLDMLASSSDPRIESWIRTLGLPEGGGHYRLRMP